MKFVLVKFNDAGKSYGYYTKQNLKVNGIYNIVADYVTTYTSPVKVISIEENKGKHYFDSYRTITKATPVSSPRPKDGLKKVIFDEEAGVTVAIWWDGSKTIVHCQEGDTFDKEKGLALCYMKKALGNRGSFNETLKKWIK